MANSEKEWDVLGELSEDGLSIVLSHGKMYKRVIAYLIGEKLRVRFSKYRAKRSDAQNRWMWGVCVPTVRAWYLETQGEKKDPDEIYMWLRIAIVGHKPEIKEMMGEQFVVMTGKRFSAMNTKEFAEAVELIVQEMDKRGCYISLPNEGNFMHDHVDDK